MNRLKTSYHELGTFQPDERLIHRLHWPAHRPHRQEHKASLAPPLSLAAVAVGADGLMIEVHPNPEMALSDGPQGLDVPAFTTLMADLPPIAASVGRELVSR